jgi:hypothetical protein
MGIMIFAIGNFVAVAKDSDELVINYMTVQRNKPVDVVFDKETGRISLRIPGGIQSLDDEKNGINFLKKQVEYIASKKEHIIILADGYTLIYKGGYPFWGPYYEGVAEGEFAYLLFSERVKVDEKKKEIIVFGSLNKPSTFYPYQLPTQ